MRYLIAMSFACILLQSQTKPPQRGLEVAGPARRALVIGNRDYPRFPLKNPANDATDLAASLRGADFEVQLALNLDLKSMERTVREFAASVHEGDTALFFFAGHGLEVDGGVNYLLPVDFAAESEVDVKYQALAAGFAQELLQARRARTVILILDACRNNPYRTWGRATGGGLAAMSGDSVYIAFAAAPGRQAGDDPAGRNGIFTKHLVATLREPGLTIDEVFNRVRAGVARETAGKQVPFSNSGLLEPFVFRDAGEERARLERELAEAEATAAAAVQAKNDRDRADAERQAKAVKDRLAILPSAPAVASAGMGPKVDLEELRRRRDEALRRVADMSGGLPASLAEAKAEVTALEAKIADLRAEIDRLRDRALSGAGVERGAFETSAQFEARRSQAEAEKARIRRQYEAQMEAEAKPWTDRIAALRAGTYALSSTLKLEWKSYDPDAGILSASVDGTNSLFRVEPAKAQALNGRWPSVIAMSGYSGAPVLIDPVTNERFRGTPAPWVNPKDGLEYARVEPGGFLMGCSPGDTECLSNEKPTHKVTLTRGFLIGVTPVTQAAWQRVMKANPSQFKGPNLPVETVSWDEADQYCRAVGTRLPTEAEYEYAARAGTTGARYGDLNAIAWYSANSEGTTHEVAGKEPNAWGLYDMLGNVWEWTADWYSSSYAAGDAVDPTGPAAGEYRALRGGSWLLEASLARASRRDWNPPESRDRVVGFRCVGE